MGTGRRQARSREEANTGPGLSLRPSWSFPASMVFALVFLVASRRTHSPTAHATPFLSLSSKPPHASLDHPQHFYEDASVRGAICTVVAFAAVQFVRAHIDKGRVRRRYGD